MYSHLMYFIKKYDEKIHEKQYPFTLSFINRIFSPNDEMCENKSFVTNIFSYLIPLSKNF